MTPNRSTGFSLKTFLFKNRWRTGIVAVLCLVTVGAGLKFYRQAPALKTSFYPVKRGDFMISIVEGGTLKAVNEVTVRCEVEGTSRIISIVPEGNYARKGDLLVELDSSDLRERLNAQQVVYQNSDFSYIQAKENLSIQKSVIESNIKDAELKVEFAKSDLEKYKEGDWPQLQKNTATKITIAEEELKRAKDRLDWTEKLHKKGYATKTELEADRLTVQRKEIECGQTREELRLLEKYDFPKKVRLLEANVDQYDKELHRLKQRSAAQVAQYEADLRSRKNQLDLHSERLKELQEQLVKSKIYAPQDGLVIYASSSMPGNGVLIEEGAQVRQRQDLIKLPDVSQMMLEVKIHESHVQKITAGLEAYITIDSLPDTQFRGRVRKVAVLPDANSRYLNPNLKVYATEIVIDDTLPDLKPGISGRAEVVITNLHSVLTVPIQAVTTVKGRHVCFVENSSGSKAVPVEVGLYNDQLIQVKSGLREDDRVLLSPLGLGDNIDLGDSIIGDDQPKATPVGTELASTNGPLPSIASTNGPSSTSQTTRNEAPVQRKSTARVYDRSALRPSSS